MWNDNNNYHTDTRIIRSLSCDPWYNLALEEHLLNHVSSNQVILYLWQDAKTVVIGKNQNAWKECRCALLEDEGGKLARRLSGGGAVYHDLGNLNFTFIMDRRLYNLQKQLSVILAAVRKMGINAEFSGRNDLTVNGKKFSGNAYYFKSAAAYHHGTILINTDLTDLTRYLQASREKIISKGIDSIRARVVNLTELNPSISTEETAQNIKKVFTEIYGGTAEEISTEKETAEIRKLYAKYSSWEWRYGETPEFDICLRNRFPWGEIEICLHLKNGVIDSAFIYSDAMNTHLIDSLSIALRGAPLRPGPIAERLDSIPTDKDGRSDLEDLKQWFWWKDL